MGVWGGVERNGRFCRMGGNDHPFFLINIDIVGQTSLLVDGEITHPA